MPVSSFSHHPRPLLTVLAAACALAVQGAAFAADDDDIATMDTIAVTTTGMTQWVQDAPASISVITREDIERKPVTSIADLLGEQPGVTGGYAVSGEQSKISLRGLPSQYTLILIDGRRQGNSSGTNYRDDLGRQDLDWISPDMIERIEVVRGPMSSLYGSDAMGGVINIITRKIAPRWKGSASANYTHPGSAERGDTIQLGANLSGPLGERFGLRLGLGQTDRRPDRPARANTKQSPGFRNQNLDLLLSWQVSADHTLEMQGTHGIQKAIGSGVMVEKPNCTKEPCMIPSVAAWGPERLTHNGFGLYHDGFYGDASSSKTSYNYNRYLSKGDPADSEATESVFDSSFNTELTWGLPQALTAGVQWKREELYNVDTVGNIPAWNSE